MSNPPYFSGDYMPGVKGDKGDTGNAGATGPTGPQGPKGDKGDKGDPASSIWTTEVYIANDAGSTYQGTNAVAIGVNAGESSQGAYSIAIGKQAGQTSQGTNCIAIGNATAPNSQGANAIALGYNIGVNTAQNANTIIINASGTEITSNTSNSFYVSPIRGNSSVGSGRTLYYDPNTHEVYYHTGSGGGA